MNVIDEVREVVSLAAGIPQDALTESQTLLYDLGLVGDDAEEMFDCLAQTFNIDMDDFVFTEHFPTEASADMYWFIARRNYIKTNNPAVRWFHSLDGLIWSLFSRKRDYKPVTIDDLICAAQTRKWKTSRE